MGLTEERRGWDVNEAVHDSYIRNTFLVVLLAVCLSFRVSRLSCWTRAEALAGCSLKIMEDSLCFRTCTLNLKKRNHEKTQHSLNSGRIISLLIVATL